MARTGAPGRSQTNPEPPPNDVRWILRPSGYRIGVRPADGEIVIEVLDYHPGYLILDRADLAKLEGGLNPKASP